MDNIVNDHDLLIQLDTKMDMLLEQFKIMPSKESVDTLCKELDRVRNKSNQYDILLLVGIVLSSIISEFIK